MDSEELSALEEMAEGESESDTEIDRLLDAAADAFPPETVSLMIKDLKQRGFAFVGSTIVYAHMQAVGMVNDHLVRCFRHREVQRQFSRGASKRRTTT